MWTELFNKQKLAQDNTYTYYLSLDVVDYEEDSDYYYYKVEACIGDAVFGVARKAIVCFDIKTPEELMINFRSRDNGDCIREAREDAEEMRLYIESCVNNKYRKYKLSDFSELSMDGYMNDSHKFYCTSQTKEICQELIDSTLRALYNESEYVTTNYMTGHLLSLIKLFGYEDVHHSKCEEILGFKPNKTNRNSFYII